MDEGIYGKESEFLMCDGLWGIGKDMKEVLKEILKLVFLLVVNVWEKRME